jgi:hypothetical protein
MMFLLLVAAFIPGIYLLNAYSVSSILHTGDSAINQRDKVSHEAQAGIDAQRDE